MNTSQALITLAVLALGTALTRFIPFWLFPEGKPVPPVIKYLGTALPPACMGLLVVYALKNVNLSAAPYGLPELLSVCVVLLLHKWKHNTLLSLFAGTAVYMLLVQLVFV